MATQLATTEQTESRPVTPLSDRRESYAIMKDKAKMFAISPLIPEALRGNNYDTAVANCLIALELANLMGEAPLVVMQNIHIVKGKAGFSAQYMIARANASNVFRGRINWRMTGSGDTLSAEAYATLAETGEEVSFVVDMAMAKAEGWTTNPKYKSVPHLMLRYRSATFLVRLYAPDVMLGYHTAEENEDIYAGMAPVQSPPLTAGMITDQATGADVPAEEIVDEGRAETDHGDAHDGTLEAAMARQDSAEFFQTAKDRYNEDVATLNDEDALKLGEHHQARIRAMGGSNG